VASFQHKLTKLTRFLEEESLQDIKMHSDDVIL